ncbi:uncharacterized protein BDW47DRAFT_108390 [Aspergillus candidus]|uniref:Uncharacterized protein n=1 Tax=Aspergillus candidus TaxID=41067 RepID=A0A2I2F7D7_ASPCN|nr:hypothetical protein BDW47DRAFT_108390 [Aspergillus candidus]PLB36541.1 hypothetical protein BDW47DRAFT_108390 [Aspergillus candidus]
MWACLFSHGVFPVSHARNVLQSPLTIALDVIVTFRGTHPIYETLLLVMGKEFSLLLGLFLLVCRDYGMVNRLGHCGWLWM